jgi:pimeloyl-ACP methyl ester carboxylesterase
MIEGRAMRRLRNILVASFILAGAAAAPAGPACAQSCPVVQVADYDDANASVYWRLIAHSFAKAGIASFSFNKRGVAGSGGKATNNFDVQAADVAAACAFASHLPGVDAKNVGYYGPMKYEFYRDPRTWAEPIELYTSLISPLLLIYGGHDDNVPVEQSIATFQRALRANSNPDVTIHIFETANHDIQIGPIKLHLTSH